MCNAFGANATWSTSLIQCDFRVAILNRPLQIAAYVKRDVTTMQFWEKRKGMPMRQHVRATRRSASLRAQRSRFSQSLIFDFHTIEFPASYDDSRMIRMHQQVL